MKKVVAAIMFILLTVSGCTSPTTDGSYDTKAFIKELSKVQDKLTYKNIGREDMFYSKATIVNIGDEILTVYQFKDQEEADKKASTVNYGGTSISGEGVNNMEISWVSYPHFYKKGSIIVLYVGDKDEIIDKLDTILGYEFAGH